MLAKSQHQTKELSSKILNINNYVSTIDSTSSLNSEGIAEGPIIYKNIFHRNGGWTAYILRENDSNKKMRIKYSASQYKTRESINLYYNNDGLVFAELSVVFKKGKQKHDVPLVEKFYFEDKNIIYQTNSNSQYYNLDYLLTEEKNILNMIE